MKKIIIAAKTKNNVIGADNDLVAHLPADLDHFYRTIKGQYLLTGRKSYESSQGDDTFHLGKKTVVVTRREDYDTSNAIVKHDLAAAFEWADQDDAESIYILGGGSIYEQTITEADVLIITHIDVEVEGDTFFPNIDEAVWREVKRQDFKKDEQNPYNYSFVWYKRNTDC